MTTRVKGAKIKRGDYFPAMYTVILMKCILHDFMQGDFGDVTDRKDLRNRLGCKSFGWYIKTMLPDMKLPETALYSGEVGVLYLRKQQQR